MTEKEKAQLLFNQCYAPYENFIHSKLEARRNALIAIKFARKYAICEDQKELDRIQKEIESL